MLRVLSDCESVFVKKKKRLFLTIFDDGPAFLGSVKKNIGLFQKLLWPKGLKIKKIKNDKSFKNLFS